ncbi:hypothetical protein K6119_08220 [Paracrocinitomix mangrovi]|uniref:hypothetical protein n=1 Tax=Paracrocinitomix mangrovi TaxID=2862509 RepID=UPI001C8CF6DB|nr:hypothetical protein [Paracrocinitomix mangrovi]UKN03498.1 hypothetical protein K6119_08220 [Paracrocinitomix mangrovi]
MRKLVYLFIFLVSFSACQGDNSTSESQQTVTPIVQDKTVETKKLKQEKAIEKPFENLDVPFKKFNYSNRNGSTINLPSGTQIKIPKKAFVDKDGNDVAEGIEIEYREFHDISDIMLSGIKMNTPDGDFESAGMFEIRAKKDGEELNLKEGKTIDMEMASYKSGNYNNYYLNDKTYEWEDLGQSTTAPNSRKSEKLEALREQEQAMEEVCITAPREYQEGDQIFDLDFGFNNYHQLGFFNGAMWVVAGDEEEKKRFRNDPKNYQEIDVVAIDTMCNHFAMSMWNHTDLQEGGKGKTNFIVQPVWKGKEYKRVKDNYQADITAYNKKANDIIVSREIAEGEADLVRKFQLRGMGIFNCDRLLDFIKLATVGLVISCKEKIKSWWYITRNKTVAVKYYDPTVAEFKFDLEFDNQIVAALPGNKLGYITNEQILEAYNNAKEKDGEPQMEIEMQIHEEPAADRNQFRNHISRF